MNFQVVVENMVGIIFANMKGVVVAAVIRQTGEVEYVNGNSLFKQSMILAGLQLALIEFGPVE